MQNQLIHFFKLYNILEKEWDWERNNNIDPLKLSNGSGRRVWWICSIKSCHKWETRLISRTSRRSGCPYCNKKKLCHCKECILLTLYYKEPTLRDEWNGNIEDMKNYTQFSNKKVSWKCRRNNICHIWDAIICNRTQKNILSGCPFCSGSKICNCELCCKDSIYYTHPDMKKFWIGNTEEMKKYRNGSTKLVMLSCEKKKCHIWSVLIQNMTRNQSIICPYCFNLKICPDFCNSIYYTHPELKEEWYGDIEDMKNYTYGSSKYVFWKCKYGHVWNSEVRYKTHKSKYSICRMCNYSRLETLHEAVLAKLNTKISKEVRVDIDQIRSYPFDFQFENSNKKIFVELQGIQHYERVKFFHRSANDFYERINIDINKNFYIFKNKHSYISFTYMYTKSRNENKSDYILDLYKKFLKKLDKVDNLIRYYLYEDYYIDVTNIKNRLSINYKIEDKNITFENFGEYFMNKKYFSIYQSIYLQLYSIFQDKPRVVSDLDFEECEICKKYILKYFKTYHTNSEYHKRKSLN